MGLWRGDDRGSCDERGRSARPGGSRHSQRTGALPSGDTLSRVLLTGLWGAGHVIRWWLTAMIAHRPGSKARGCITDSGAMSKASPADTSLGAMENASARCRHGRAPRYDLPRRSSPRRPGRREHEDRRNLRLRTGATWPVRREKAGPGRADHRGRLTDQAVCACLDVAGVGGKVVKDQVSGQPHRPRPCQSVTGFAGGKGAFAPGTDHGDPGVARPVGIR